MQQFYSANFGFAKMGSIAVFKYANHFQYGLTRADILYIVFVKEENVI